MNKIGNITLCKYYLPCGMCELTKEQCKNMNWQYVPQWDTTPIPCQNPYEPMCTSSDTFRIHPESEPRYS